MIECVATERAVVANVATPPGTILLVPILLAPSKNVTVPVAVEGEVAALNVTLAPNVDGFNEDVSVVVVGALLTT